MKKSDKKVIIFLFTMVFASLIFMSKSLNKELYIVVYWLIFGGLSLVTYAYQKDRTRYKIDYIQIILIYLLIYFVTTYLSGLAFGFIRVPYSISIIKIVKNISFPLICIVVEEMLRKTLIKDRDQFKFIFFGVIVAFSLIEILVNFNAYSWTSAVEIFEGISLLIVPTIAKNALLTYLTAKCGIFPSLIYHIIMGLYVYFVPILPDFGMYISSIISIIFPAIVFLKFNTLLSKDKILGKREKIKFKKILYIPTIMIILIIVLLVSGLFKYTAISIGSGSMKPKINIGDVVVLEKLKDEELNNIKEGDVLVYRHDSKIIVHRVVEVSKTYYRTMGDNNNNVEDNYNILRSDVIGVVRFKIPYIGYPSVWLSEKIG